MTTRNDWRDDGLSENYHDLGIEIIRRAIRDTQSCNGSISYPALMFLHSQEAADFCTALGVDIEVVKRRVNDSPNFNPT